VPVTATSDIDDRLDAARRGDERAFEALVAPHLRALHLHCYRMLGSYADADDAMQESLLRAWRGLAGFEGRSPLRHWLYRITTTTCLRLIERRGRTPVDGIDVAWLQPYPDILLDQLTDHDADPAAIVDRRESVALAFITALQLLPGTQRAVLILREVLDWPAQQVAELLGTTVAAVNSALQRARATLARTDVNLTMPRPLDDGQRRVLDAFVRAWHARDLEALVALLRDDATLTMPPQAVRITGRAEIVEFFATVPAGGRLDLIRLVVTAANGQPALAAYLPDGHREQLLGYGVMVFTIGDELISAIVGFPEPEIFPGFGLSLTT
jgi:RNA polymerase sigma-70 factor (ECF subfamily)